VAIVRQAYLMMFFYFGYGYALFEQSDPIRSQILVPEVEGEPLLGIVTLNEPQVVNTIGILREPRELRCFFVVLDLSTLNKRFFGVVMPGMEPHAEQVYQRWSELGRRGLQGLRPQIDFISYDPAFITDTAHRNLPLRIWRGQVEIVDQDYPRAS
jgi:hypothetical protein